MTGVATALDASRAFAPSLARAGSSRRDDAALPRASRARARARRVAVAVRASSRRDEDDGRSADDDATPPHAAPRPTSRAAAASAAKLAPRDVTTQLGLELSSLMKTDPVLFERALRDQVRARSPRPAPVASRPPDPRGVTSETTRRGKLASSSHDPLPSAPSPSPVAPHAAPSARERAPAPVLPRRAKRRAETARPRRERVRGGVEQRVRGRLGGAVASRGVARASVAVGGGSASFFFFALPRFPGERARGAAAIVVLERGVRPHGGNNPKRNATTAKRRHPTRSRR